ncbi:hypothetical protein TKK_0018806 [Trichogramma kaykai]
MAPPTLKIIFWNVRSVACRFFELQKAAAEFDVVACLESWLNKQNLSIPGFHTLRKDRKHSRGGGIVVWVRKYLAFETIKINLPFNVAEMFGLRLKNCGPELDVVICYRPPSFRTTLQDWKNIVQCVDVSRAALFMGDFNAHNTSWNCALSNNNGLNFEQAYVARGLSLQNFNMTTFRNLRSNYSSNIDLILTTQNIDHMVSTEVCDDSWGSDHHPVFVNVSIERHCHFQQRLRISSTRTYWSNVIDHLDENFSCFFTSAYESSDAADKYNTFYSVVKEAIQAHTPRKASVPKRKHKNPVPWWDADCDRAKWLRQAAFKKFNFSLDMMDLITYKKRCKCKIFKNKWIDADNSQTYDSANNSLMRQRATEKLCPPWAETDPELLPRCCPNDFLDDQFSFMELNIALEEKSEKSAPELDGIGFDAIKKLPTKHRLLLLDIFNEMYMSESFPEAWKKIHVFFIKKLEGRGLRPVSLTSCFCKLFETSVKNRLHWWAEVNGWIPDNQHGFRRGHSCADNLAGLALTAEDAFLESRDVLTAFLDVEEAFDNVCIDVLLEKLAALGCSRRVVKFVKFATRERFIHLQGDSLFGRVFKGVPQGAVLGPLLYSLYVYPTDKRQRRHRQPDSHAGHPNSRRHQLDIANLAVYPEACLQRTRVVIPSKVAIRAQSKLLQFFSNHGPELLIACRTINIPLVTNEMTCLK